MLVATWNVNSLKARMPRVEEWLNDVSPDIVCLQETKMSDDNFPALTFASMGYEAVHNGQGQWNGVAILSKVGLSEPTYGFASGIEPDPDARLISATCGSIRVHSVYVPNGRALDHDHYRYKLSWFERLVEHLDQTTSPDEDVIVAGDWNVAPTDIDVWDTAVFEGQTHVSTAERDAFTNVVDWGLVDTFRQRYPGQAKLYSYFDYQAGRFHKRQGIRIDAVLSSASLAETSRLDIFDRNARKGTKPSDHVPVLAGFS